METFADFLQSLDDETQKQKLGDLFNFIDSEFPNIDKRIAWNQPMYTDHDTFIIGFSVAKNHISVAPEKAGLRQFEREIKENNYELLKEIFKIKKSQPINKELIRDMIAFNIEDKKNCKTFWRK
ncbi:iron chaperone [Alkalibacterium sp. f15]|uniref:iron chaperone n=1 Tax=Alkalibacterium sp. f15 TaxID=3414029 RepID=UPI003BF7D0FD